jgi:hypothetical protein
MQEKPLNQPNNVEIMTFLHGLVHNYAIVKYSDREDERRVQLDMLPEAEQELKRKISRLLSLYQENGPNSAMQIDTLRHRLKSFVKNEVKFINPTNIKDKILSKIGELE